MRELLSRPPEACRRCPVPGRRRFLSPRLLLLGLLLHSGLAAGALALPSLEPVAPDLGALEEGPRQRLEALQRAVATLESDGAGPAALAEAYGSLGQHCQAYDLLQAARAAYGNARALAPEDFRWAYYHGLVLHVLGDFEAALAAYEQALAARPGDPASALRAGRALLELGRFEEAGARFESLLARDPEHAAAVYGLAKVLAAEGDFPAAIERFERVLALEPEASIVHYPLAQAYRRAGDLEQAREHLALRGTADVPFEDPLGSAVAWLTAGTALEVVQALAAATEELPDRDYLGFALGQLAGVEGAAEKLEEALAAPGGEVAERARMHYVLGGLLVDRRDDERALGHFQAALELDPELLDARVKVGNILARRGRWDEAVEAYSEVLARDPENRPALLKRAAARMASSEDARALPDLETLVALDPRATEPRIRLATALLGAGRGEEALAHFRSALELELSAEERSGVHRSIGDLLRAAGELPAAERQYRLALEQDDGSGRTHFRLAGLLGQLGRFEEAARHYRRVVELEPGNAAGRFGEATALNLAGRWAEALATLRQGTAELPEALELRHALARQLATSPDRGLRDGAEALELAREVFETLPSFEHAATVAMALAEAGRFEEARKWQQTLLAQAEERGDRRAAAQARAHLALYARGEACCG